MYRCALAKSDATLRRTLQWLGREMTSIFLAVGLVEELDTSIVLFAHAAGWWENRGAAVRLPKADTNSVKGAERGTSQEYLRQVKEFNGLDVRGGGEAGTGAVAGRSSLASTTLHWAPQARRSPPPPFVPWQIELYELVQSVFRQQCAAAESSGDPRLLALLSGAKTGDFQAELAVGGVRRIRG